MGAGTQETELAFTVLDRVGLENHSLFQKAEQIGKRRLISTYYDTPSHVLATTGWTVRRRLSEGRWYQTIKGPRSGVSRPELEIEIDDNALQIDHLRSTPVWQIIGFSSDDLVPIFETNIERTLCYLTTGTATIELAIDDGDVLGMRGDRERIHDLELEVKHGDAASLFLFATILAMETRIRIEDCSKAERGYRLINGNAVQAHKHEDIVLVKQADMRDDFREIANNVLAHLRRNIEAAYHAQPHGIHQLRIAIRRMRAVLRLFRDLLPHTTVDVFDLELQYFGYTFGTARDWDVFITETLANASRDLSNSLWVALIQYCARSYQVRAHSEVKRIIDGRRFNSLIVSLMGWVDNPPLRPDDLPANKILPGLLDSISAKADARRRKVTQDPETLHALRKSMKSLRYATEFTGSLYPTKAVRAFLKPCKEVQEALGQLNDSVTTEKLMQTLVGDNPAIVPAVEELSRWLSQQQRTTDAALSKALHHLRDDKPFWT